MEFRRMNATFGKLQNETLTLRSGLNCIYAPNESGKSTWSHFLRVMLYGLPTRDRGALADKNRFSPWNGSAMEGQLDICTDGAERYTLSRTTRRAGAPMGEFSCCYSGTATPVEGITGLNAGESLLGIPREVFERSAFIRHSALAVEQDAELERRIAALITTGEEDTSYTEVNDRLKRQLNRRRHNKTGLIPALEAELSALREQSKKFRTLAQQVQTAQQTREQQQARLSTLLTQQSQWEALQLLETAQRYDRVCRDAKESAERLETLRNAIGPLPEDGALAAMEGQCAAAMELRTQAGDAEAKARAARGEAEAANGALERHPLFGEDRSSLETRLSALSAAPPPTRALWGIPAGCGGLGVVFLVFAIVSGGSILPLVGAAVSFFGGAMAALAVHRHIRRSAERNESIAQQRKVLEDQIAAYLPLQQAAQQESEKAQRAASAAGALTEEYRRQTTALLAALLPYGESDTVEQAQAILHRLRRQRGELDQAREAAQRAAERLEMEKQHLPAEPLPDPDTALPLPTMARSEVDTELAQVRAQVQNTQSLLDTLAGQLRSLGNQQDVESQLRQKERRLQELQREYDAVAMAMEVLGEANTSLQNRFSPALGARSAEIFSAITGGKYGGVLLSRDFSMEAQEEGGTVSHSVQLLSQGAADQLYLAVRLAICDMVLPQDKSVPLILDDALLSFDEERLHAALDYLLKESRRRQVILFTCQKREQEYLHNKDDVTLLQL